MSGSDTLRNLVMVGDGQTGKTHLFYSFLRGKSPEECFLPLSNSITHDMEVNGTKLSLGLTPVKGEYKTNDLLMADVVIMCFALDNPDSLQNITDKWVPEISGKCPKCPFILVGTKLDLRKDKKAKTMPQSKGKAVAKSIEAVNYLECSSVTKHGVMEVFEAAAKTVLNGPLVNKVHSTKPSDNYRRTLSGVPSFLAVQHKEEQDEKEEKKLEETNHSGDTNANTKVSNSEAKPIQKQKQKKSGCTIL